MTDLTWILVLAVTSGLFGRALKLWPHLPPTALPWCVLLAGFACGIVLGIYEGLPLSQAALQAWRGLAGGVLATGGHENLKGLLVPILGDAGSKAVLGKLSMPPRPTPRLPRRNGLGPGGAS